MNKATLVRCLRGIEDSFSSNEARANPFLFAQKQLNIVVNSANTLTKIDPLDSGAVTHTLIDTFTVHAKRILCETYRLCTDTKTSLPSGSNVPENQIEQNSVASIRQRIRKLQNEASIGVTLALCAQTTLQNGRECMGGILQRLEPALCRGSSVVAVIGAVHKGELFKKEGIAEAAERWFKHVIDNSQVISKLTCRECSLLLWRRVATRYMKDAPTENCLRQISTLIYHCHEKLKDEVYLNFGEDPLEMSRLQQDSGPLTLPDERALKRLNQTLSNVNQAALIMRHCETYSGASNVLHALGPSSIDRLSKMLTLAWRLQGRARRSHKSSDTHTKVGLAVADAMDGRHMRCIYENPVGNSAYTVDILVTI
ncbi:Eukaryotic translation initiation factor 2-alpha kinase 4, putative [Babesia ovata]|uniref:Eukaryotic translation initiation factor 2-alpha kinase 4, putative n=1 Tax=Babesia ovata TaxID=189622 RepID=A0A2H6KAT9_9APIC|nr:Eukaryotic translation initiation factor 2-alpha kinase 4, putative [Babesia ovata]GBE60112.1 Eukaryotic translation initiation factor 2-alpha kinase 4, putative [Babesia ovata]